MPYIAGIDIVFNECFQGHTHCHYDQSHRSGHTNRGLPWDISEQIDRCAKGRNDNYNTGDHTPDTTHFEARARKTYCGEHRREGKHNGTDSVAALYQDLFVIERHFTEKPNRGDNRK